MRRNNLHRRSNKPLLRRSGLPDIRLYNFRHTFARLVFENREQLKLVSGMLGHASVKQTAVGERSYQNRSSSVRRARYNILYDHNPTYGESSGQGWGSTLRRTVPRRHNQAVRSVLSEPRFKRNAARIQAEFARHYAPTEAAALLEKLAVTKHPVNFSPEAIREERGADAHN